MSMIKLNIGAGPNIFPHPGWINYDRENIDGYLNHLRTAPTFEGMPEHQRELTRYLRVGGEVNFRVHDLRKGFPQHADGSVDLIYLGQVIEHLNPVYEIPKLLRECYRMLRPGGVLRITTPDLNLLIKAYLGRQMDRFAVEQPAFYKDADPASQLAYIMFGACGPNCTWTNYEGHMFLFTPESMIKHLRDAEFSVIFSPQESSASTVMAAECVDAGMSHSFVAEAVR